MKVTFEFDTDNENFSQCQLEAHYQAESMSYCLSEILKQLREWYSYDSRGSIPTTELNDTLQTIIHENVNMEKLGY